MSENMRVIKRTGEYQNISFDKILERIRNLTGDINLGETLNIDETLIAQKVIQEIYDGIETSKLDELTSQIAISLYSKNVDYKVLASRISISNHHKNTLDSFSEKVKLLYNYEFMGKNRQIMRNHCVLTILFPDDQCNNIYKF